MGETGGELGRRSEAVRRVQAGRAAAVVARELGRSEWWIHKWLRRYEAEGEEGLRDRSRAPRRRRTATPERVVARILEARREESESGGVSTDAILYELECQGFTPLPSRATVGRVLRRAGVAGTSSSGIGRPSGTGPGPPSTGRGSGSRPRYLARRVSFSSLHLVDAGGAAASLGDVLSPVP